MLFDDIPADLYGELEYDLLPKMARVRQNYHAPAIDDVEAEVIRQMNRPEIASLVKPGAKIAVMVGSRGVAEIALITRTVLNQLKARQAAPFIVPAMASHGGATEQGQLDLLASYGVTEASMGVPIRSVMEPVQVGTSSAGVPVWFDSVALAADGIVPINRIKAHTAFRATRESGLIKMLAIGAGKQKGAEALHSHGADTFGTVLPEAFEIIRKKANVLFGVGTVENAHDRPAVIEAVPVDKMLDREVELLQLANQLMARILIPEFDVLIVRRTGKNYSGDGMDPNVTGRYAVPGMSGGPSYQRLALLGMSDETHGNAIGMGMADVVPRKLVESANFGFMYLNAFTSKMVLPLIRIPLVAADQRQAIAIALRSCVRVNKGAERVVLIDNTLELVDIQVSEALLPWLAGKNEFEQLSAAEPMRFGPDGELVE